MAALSLSVSALKTGQKTKEKNEILLTDGFQSHLFCLLEHKLESSIVLIGYDTIQNSILDGALQAADFPAWLQVEDFHNLGAIHRWLEITDAVFLLKVFQFLTHQLEVVEKTLFAHFIFRSDVCLTQQHQVVNVIAGFEPAILPKPSPSRRKPGWKPADRKHAAKAGQRHFGQPAASIHRKTQRTHSGRKHANDRATQHV